MNVHKGDPITSYEAAAAIEPVRHAHKAKVLAALAQHPGAIASELAEVVGFDPVETRRRLTDLSDPLYPVDKYLPERIDWVIVGGESGPKARPFDLAWARSIVAQCREAGVPVFVKQLGWRPYLELGPGSPNAVKVVHFLDLKSRKGGDMAEWPEDLRVREWPV